MKKYLRIPKNTSKKPFSLCQICNKKHLSLSKNTSEHLKIPQNTCFSLYIYLKQLSLKQKKNICHNKQNLNLRREANTLSLSLSLSLSYQPGTSVPKLAPTLSCPMN
jgi:hypothetical protein